MVRGAHEQFRLFVGLERMVGVFHTTLCDSNTEASAQGARLGTVRTTPQTYFHTQSTGVRDTVVVPRPGVEDFA
jgi:hypothetical protein